MGPQVASSDRDDADGGLSQLPSLEDLAMGRGNPWDGPDHARPSSTLSAALLNVAASCSCHTLRPAHISPLAGSLKCHRPRRAALPFPTRRTVTSPVRSYAVDRYGTWHHLVGRSNSPLCRRWVAHPSPRARPPRRTGPLRPPAPSSRSTWTQKPRGIRSHRGGLTPTSPSRPRPRASALRTIPIR